MKKCSLTAQVPSPRQGIRLPSFNCIKGAFDMLIKLIFFHFNQINFETNQTNREEKIEPKQNKSYGNK